MAYLNHVRLAYGSTLLRETELTMADRHRRPLLGPELLRQAVQARLWHDAEGLPFGKAGVKILLRNDTSLLARSV